MKTFKYILFLLLIAIIGSAIYIAVQPNEFEFSRSRVIKAPKSLLFNKVNDFKNWPSFSPWIEKASEAVLIYGEKTSGPGGNYSWNGKILGEGAMTTSAVEDNKSISQHIVFTNPFKSESNINVKSKPILHEISLSNLNRFSIQNISVGFETKLNQI